MLSSNYNALATVTIDFSSKSKNPTLEPDQAINVGMMRMQQEQSANGLQNILGEEIPNKSDAITYHQNVYDMLDLTLTYRMVRQIDIGLHNEFLSCVEEKCNELDQERKFAKKRPKRICQHNGCEKVVKNSDGCCNVHTSVKRKICADCATNNKGRRPNLACCQGGLCKSCHNIKHPGAERLRCRADGCNGMPRKHGGVCPKCTPHYHKFQPKSG